MSKVTVRQSVDVAGKECWVAEHPDHPEVFAIADSRSGAKAQFSKALAAWEAAFGSKSMTETSSEGTEELTVTAKTTDASSGAKIRDLRSTLVVEAR